MCLPYVSSIMLTSCYSSMANIAGYKAVLEASNNFGTSRLNQTSDMTLKSAPCRARYDWASHCRWVSPTLFVNDP